MEKLSIKKVLVERDGLTESEAQEQVNNAREDLNEMLGNGEIPIDFCLEEFGLEDDYLLDLI